MSLVPESLVTTHPHHTGALAADGHQPFHGRPDQFRGAFPDA